MKRKLTPTGSRRSKMDKLIKSFAVAQIIVMLTVITAPMVCYTYKVYTYDEAVVSAQLSFRDDVYKLKHGIDLGVIYINPNKAERKKMKESKEKRANKLKLMKENMKSIISDKTQAYLNKRNRVCVEDAIPIELMDLRYNAIAIILLISSFAYLIISRKRK